MGFGALVAGRAALVRNPARVGLLVVLPTVMVLGAGLPPTATATSPSSTTIAATTLPPTSEPASTSTIATTTTLPATTTTTTLPPVDLLAGVPWIQRSFASPCSDGAVQMIGGSAIDNGSIAVIDDVLALDAYAGLAVAFLTCHGADGTATESTAVLVRVAAPGGVVESLGEQTFGARATVTDVQLPAITVETPEGLPVAGSCCAPFVRRRSFTVALDGFHITDDTQVSAFNQAVPSAPAVGGNGDLVRASVSAAALCYRWDNVYLATQDPGEDPPTVTEPSAELQTVRLALIHVTGLWITPTSQMSPEMARVVTAYQESRGLAVDGIIGDETTATLAADLGCLGDGSFTQVMPPTLGPRRFPSVPEFLAATQQYASVGTSGNPSLDALLLASGWDGANALFLGCYRWEMPVAGMSCSWSGTTPLQLIGLVDDVSVPGIGGFSILYGRSAPPAMSSVIG